MMATLASQLQARTDKDTDRADKDKAHLGENGEGRATQSLDTLFLPVTPPACPLPRWAF